MCVNVFVGDAEKHMSTELWEGPIYYGGKKFDESLCDV